MRLLLFLFLIVGFQGIFLDFMHVREVSASVAHAASGSVAGSSSVAGSGSVAGSTSEAKKSDEVRLVIIGDSLCEGYGVAKEQGFVSLLEKKFEKSSRKVTIVNTSISGSTTASAKGRIQWQLKAKQKPTHVFLALGGNDGLRGLKISEVKKNLEEAIELAKKNGIKIILVGMLAPPNYGKEYSEQFIKVFEELKSKYNPIWIPFLLKDVAGVAKVNQADGIHPNEEGHKIIAETVFEILKKDL